MNTARQNLKYNNLLQAIIMLSEQAIPRGLDAMHVGLSTHSMEQHQSSNENIMLTSQRNPGKHLRTLSSVYCFDRIVTD